MQKKIKTIQNYLEMTQMFAVDQNIFLHYWKLYRFTNRGLKFVFRRTKGLRFEDGLWNQTKPIVKAKILPLMCF